MSLPAPAPVYYSRRALGYLKDLWNRREFAWFLAMANLKARNASTTLGLFWWVLNPLILGMVYFLIFGLFFPNERDIAYLLSGIFVYHFTSQALTGGANSILQNSKLLANLKFPRIILPVANLIESGAGFLVSLLVLYAIIIPVKGIFPGPELAVLLVVFPLQVLFNLGLGTIAARLAVPFRDINNILPYVSRIWLYTSPIIWPLSFLDRASSTLQDIIRLNPLFSGLSVYRTALLGYPFEPQMLIQFSLYALLVSSVGIAIFVKYEGRMVRYL